MATDHVVAVAVIVDPIDEEAKQYYQKYGFILLPDSGRMFMSMQTIESTFHENKNERLTLKAVNCDGGRSLGDCV